MDKSRSPAANSGEFANWTLPEVASGQPVGREPGDRIVARTLTARQLDDITQQAHREGFAHGAREGRAAGMKQGLEEGRAAAQAELAQHVNELKALMQQLLDPLASQSQQIETAMTQLSLDIARAVLDRAPVLTAEELLPIVRRAVRELPVGDRNVTVVLHPQQLQLIRDCEEWPAQWRLQADARVALGGCKVVTDHSLVDYSVEMRFRQVAAQMLSVENNPEPPEPGLMLDPRDV